MSVDENYGIKNADTISVIKSVANLINKESDMIRNLIDKFTFSKTYNSKLADKLISSKTLLNMNSKFKSIEHKSGKFFPFL